MPGCFPTANEGLIAKSEVEKLHDEQEEIKKDLLAIRYQNIQNIREHQETIFWLKELDRRLDRLENYVFSENDAHGSETTMDQDK